MLTYNLLAYLGVMPQDGLASRLICAAHLVPFPTAWACCAFHPRLWLTMMPKYFVLVDGSICLCGRWRTVLALLLLLCAKSISVSFVYSSGELWVLDQSDTPPSCSIMPASITCTS